MLGMSKLNAGEPEQSGELYVVPDSRADVVDVPDMTTVHEGVDCVMLSDPELPVTTPYADPPPAATSQTHCIVSRGVAKLPSGGIVWAPT